MARKVRDTNLETRAARQRLKSRDEPYWRALDQGLHIGYRKRPIGGSWTSRRRNAIGRYQEVRLGAADDIQDADGLSFLSYWQALDGARVWHVEQGRLEVGLDPLTGRAPDDAPTNYTVADTLRDYLLQYSREGKSEGATRSAVDAHILPALGSTHVAKLSTKQISDWHHKLATSPARRRRKKGAKADAGNGRELTSDQRRKRKATANRVLTILKAALNHAWKDGRASSDQAWRRVKPFREVDQATVRYLTSDECIRLVNACDPELHDGFRDLVRGALLTGCRYGELSVMECRDFNAQAGTLTVRASKSGKPRHVTLTDEAQRFFAEITAGLSGTTRIFRREEAKVWGKSHQYRPMLEACKVAKISPAISFHILRHTHGSLLAMRGVPMAVIAKQLGHADTRMTEKHYAHLSPSYVAETIRAHFPTLGIVPTSKVQSLRRRRAS